MSGADEGFVERWSRRKSAVREATETNNTDTEVPSPPAVVEPAAPPDLPEIESLDAESDYSVFMQEGVPEEVRNLALRTLWRSDPVLANLDGLNDYDEDFAAILDAGAEAMHKLANALDTDAPDDASPASDGAEEQDVVAVPETDGEEIDSDGEEEIT